MVYSLTAAQVSDREYVFVVDDHFVIDDVILVSMPSTMVPGPSSIVLAIVTPSEVLQTS